MGFEQDYERAARVPGLGPVITSLKHSAGSTCTAQAGEKFISRFLRGPAGHGVHQLSRLVQEAVLDLHRLHVQGSPGRINQRLTQFGHDVGLICDRFTRTTYLRLFGRLAHGELRVKSRGGSSLTGQPRDVAFGLIDKFLRHLLSIVLRPALPIIRSNSRESQREVETRVEEGVSKMRLSNMIEACLDGRTREVRADRSPRRPTKDLLRQSLLLSSGRN